MQDLLGEPCYERRCRFFDGGNIILGGDGSDIIEGRGGDDLIDGDAWLNVRISVRENRNGPRVEIASFDSMEPLIPFMLDGTYNPGQLQIVREILYATDVPPAEGPNFDTAKFSGALFVADGTGTLVQQYRSGSTVSCKRSIPMVPTAWTRGNDIVTVTDLVGSDGIDSCSTSSACRSPIRPSCWCQVPTVAAWAADDLGTPTENQALTVSIAGVTDADEITAPVAYFWQVETAPDSGAYEDILVEPRREKRRAPAARPSHQAMPKPA